LGEKDQRNKNKKEKHVESYRGKLPGENNCITLWGRDKKEKKKLPDGRKAVDKFRAN